MRYSIEEYSKKFKMSKEMIHSRIKNKKLNYIIDNNKTFIIVTQNSMQKHLRPTLIGDKESKDTAIKEPKETKITAGTIIALYQKENTHLKMRIKILEEKIDKLVDDKERMLIEDRDRIESVYKSKDEQLKTVLNLINTKLLLSQEAPNINEIEASTVLDEMLELENSHKIIDLKSYLKTLHLSNEDKKTIKKRFFKARTSDTRIVEKDGELLLDFSKYDYSDLLKLDIS